MELAVFVVAEDQRVEVPGAGRVSADHEFLASIDAHLLPGSGAHTRLVAAIEALGHESLKSLRLHGPDQIGKARVEERGFTDRLTQRRQQPSLKQLSAVSQRRRHCIAAIKDQEIKYVIQKRRCAGAVIF